jgi:hypothetical protein
MAWTFSRDAAHLKGDPKRQISSIGLSPEDPAVAVKIQHPIVLVRDPLSAAPVRYEVGP